MTELKDESVSLMLRLRVESKQLLKDAAHDQRRSMASLVDSLIRQHLGQYEKTASRLDRLLKQ
jgi:uncharacterized protein (DUF1778 family)